MCLSFAGCGTSSETQGGGADDTSTESASSEPSKAYEEPESSGLSVQAGTVYEGNDVKISVTGAEETQDEVKLSFLFESSSDLDLSFNVHAYSVNGVMTDNNIYEMGTSLPAGKKANNTLEISKDWMEDIGAGDFQYADILFWAYDDAESYKAFETDIVRVTADSFESDLEYESEEKSYDENGIEVGKMLFDRDTAYFSVINKTDSYFSFDMVSASVNGYGYDPGIQIYDKIVFPGAIDVCEFELDDDFKEKNGMDEIEEVEFKLNYRPLDEYMDEETTGTIVLK